MWGEGGKEEARGRVEGEREEEKEAGGWVVTGAGGREAEPKHQASLEWGPSWELQSGQCSRYPLRCR